MKRKNKKNILRDLTLNELVLLIEEYNKKHNTQLTYGKFCEFLYSGRVKLN